MAALLKAVSALYLVTLVVAPPPVDPQQPKKINPTIPFRSSATRGSGTTQFGVSDNINIPQYSSADVYNNPLDQSSISQLDTPKGGQSVRSAGGTLMSARRFGTAYPSVDQLLRGVAVLPRNKKSIQWDPTVVFEKDNRDAFAGNIPQYTLGRGRNIRNDMLPSARSQITDPDGSSELSYDEPPAESSPQPEQVPQEQTIGRTRLSLTSLGPKLSIDSSPSSYGYPYSVSAPTRLYDDDDEVPDPELDFNNEDFQNLLDTEPLIGGNRVGGITDRVAQNMRSRQRQINTA
ncbi:hypothetical protein ABW19_dt0207803 [Dactylella cylindrospora]|nr:hypothetical protein ABW19_dt0207803 [Dactylella cylindrospora]